MSGIWIFGGSNIRHENAVLEIIAERGRQDQLKAEGRFKYTCADSEMSDFERFACLGEEHGEVAEAVLTMQGLAEARARGRAGDDHIAHLRLELVQVAAVALAWLESDDLNPEPISTPPKQPSSSPVLEEGERPAFRVELDRLIELAREGFDADAEDLEKLRDIGGDDAGDLTRWILDALEKPADVPESRWEQGRIEQAIRSWHTPEPASPQNNQEGEGR